MEGNRKWFVRDVERNGYTLVNVVDDDLSVLHHGVRSTEVLETCHNSDAGRINQIAVVVENMDICTDVPAADSLDNAKRFCI